MANDSNLFFQKETLIQQGYKLNGNIFEKLGSEPEKYLPLYEAKMIHHFDYKWATYDSGSFRYLTPEEKADPNFYVLPRYWVSESEVRSRLPQGWTHNWMLGWRDITNSTNERTVIASMFPVCGCCNTLPLMFLSDSIAPLIIKCLIAVFSSYALDYCARLKIGGTHLTYNYLKQLPVPNPTEMEALAKVISNDAAFDSQAQAGFPTPNTSTDEARIFSFYGFSRSDIEHAMDSFPIVRRKDEAEHGYYKTKEEILKAFDELDTPNVEPQDSDLPIICKVCGHEFLKRDIRYSDDSAFKTTEGGLGLKKLPRCPICKTSIGLMKAE